MFMLGRVGEHQVYWKVQTTRVQRKSFLKLAIQASWSYNTLAQTSFQLAPKTYWCAELISQFFCYLNSSKKFTRPSDKLRTKWVKPNSKINNRTLIFMISEFFEWWNWAGRSQVTMTCLKEVSPSVLTKTKFPSIVLSYLVPNVRKRPLNIS